MPKCCDHYRGPGRPRQFDLREREAIILDAAERVIVQKGLGAASMAAIALEAGMSKRTLYEVFENRATLFASIVRRIRNTITRPLSAEEQALPLDKRLRILLTPATEELPGPVPTAILRAVVTEAERQPDLAHEFLQEGPYALHAMIQTELDRSVARGEIRIANTAEAARLMSDMAHDSILEHLVMPVPPCEKLEAFHRRLELAIRVFLGGIGE